MKHLLFAALLSLPAVLFTSCSAETAKPVEAASTIAHSTHGVKCGCDIEEVDRCGNYVDIDGMYYEFDKEVGEGTKLDAMEWCGVDGASAEVEGEIKDGIFTATMIKKIQP